MAHIVAVVSSAIASCLLLFLLILMITGRVDPNAQPFIDMLYYNLLVSMAVALSNRTETILVRAKCSASGSGFALLFALAWGIYILILERFETELVFLVLILLLMSILYGSIIGSVYAISHNMVAKALGAKDDRQKSDDTKSSSKSEGTVE